MPRKDRTHAHAAPRGKLRAGEGRRGRLGGFGLTLAGAAGFALFAAALWALLTVSREPLGLKLGDLAPRTFAARVRFARINLDATRIAREEAGRSAPAVFRSVPSQQQVSAAAVVEAVRDGERSMLWQTLPDGVDRAAFARGLPRIRRRIWELQSALEAMGRRGTVRPGDMAQWRAAQKQTSELCVREPSGAEHLVEASEPVFLDPADAEFARSFEPVTGGMTQMQARGTLEVFSCLLKPDLEFAPDLTAQRAEAAASRVPGVVEVVDAGRVILAEGEEATRQSIGDLAREREQYDGSSAGRLVRLQATGGRVVLTLMLLAGGLAYVRRYRPAVLRSVPQALATALVTLAAAGTARFCVIWGVTPLWMPVPLVVMVMCLVFDRRFGLGMAVFYAALTRLACPGADFEFAVLLIGGVSAALLTGEVRTRSTLIKAGLATGAALFVAVWGLGLMSALDRALVPLRFWESPLLKLSLVALLNGVLSGFVVTGLLPAIERLFGVTTDIRLLEWSDPNQPLLQRLLLEAPGSYHHSMVVGSLAADAAEAVGANPLLARVSAYFHDVGKLKKPDYFAENLPSGAPNPHDQLSPTMSSLIITGHPRDGAEMAEAYGVPRVIRDAILQSHGSSLLQYFWDKAQRQENERDAVQERSFRYRLPKPQTKEAAIVMLCDAVESAARSLDAPSGGQICSLTRQIITDRLQDGQLDESELTITDLKRLEDNLVHGLTAAFHSRVRYPGQEGIVREPVPQAAQGRTEGAARQQAPAEAAPAAEGERNARGDS
jgi:putative nucleotidyltransferase with HDIG domain